MTSLLQFIVIALAVAAISMTVTRAVIFESVREEIKLASPFFGELFSCPYCFSHYVAALFACAVEPIFSNVFFNWLVITFSLVAVSAMFTRLMDDARDW